MSFLFDNEPDWSWLANTKPLKSKFNNMSIYFHPDNKMKTDENGDVYIDRFSQDDNLDNVLITCRSTHPELGGYSFMTYGDICLHQNDREPHLGYDPYVEVVFTHIVWRLDSDIDPETGVDKYDHLRQKLDKLDEECCNKMNEAETPEEECVAMNKINERIDELMKELCPLKRYHLFCEIFMHGLHESKLLYDYIHRVYELYINMPNALFSAISERAFYDQDLDKIHKLINFDARKQLGHTCTERIS